MGKHIREYSYHNCLKTVSIRQFWTAGNIVSIFPDKILLKIIREVFAENLDFTDFSLHFSDYFLLWYDRSTQLWASILGNKVTVIVWKLFPFVNFGRRVIQSRFSLEKILLKNNPRSFCWKPWFYWLFASLLGLFFSLDNAPLPGAGDGAQARYPCAPTPFRLPSVPVCHTLSMKNAPAGFGRSEVDVLKLFDGWWWKNGGCCGRLNTSTIHNGRTANHDNCWDMFAPRSWNILRVASSIFSGAALLLLLSFSAISEMLLCNKDSMVVHHFNFSADYKIIRRKNSLWGQK